MSSNSSFRVDDPRCALPPMSAPASVEFDPATRAGYLEDISLLMASMEGSFPYGSGTLPDNSAGFQPTGSSSTAVATGNVFTNSAFLGLEALAATNATAPAPATVPPLLMDYGAPTHGFDFLSDASDMDLAALLTPCTPTDVDPMPPLTKDAVGNQPFLPQAWMASTSNFASSSKLFSDFGIPGNSQAENVFHAPAWDGIPFTSQPQWDVSRTSAPVGMSEPEIMSDWSWLDGFYTNPNTEAQVNFPAATVTTGGAMGPGTVLGKRARESSSSGSSRKRGRPSTNWVLEAERSARRIHHMPAPRARQLHRGDIYDSMTQSREACPTTVQGLYPHPSPGPSALQEVGSPDQEQFKKGASLETPHGNTEGQDSLYPIPGNLTLRQQMMLRITEGEARRRAVSTIKCKFCLDVALGSWQCYRRHCNEAEDHPAKLTYCDQCGDHFARPDSMKRHAKKNGETCLRTKPDDAERKKRTTQWYFNDFDARFERCLRTGEELGCRFTETIPMDGSSTSKKAPKKKSRGNA